MGVNSFDFNSGKLLPNSDIMIPDRPGDDYGANTSTTGSVTVGGTVTGNIEVEIDEDWFAINLTAGQTITIDLVGLSLDDPIVSIYNASGTLLGYNDDANTATFNSQLVFTALTSGTYYIEASAYPWTTFDNVGLYSLSVTSGGSTGGGGGGGGLAGSIPSPTTNPLLMDIDWGTQLDTNNVNVYFAPAGYSADGYTSEGFNAYEIGQFQLAFDLIESFTNLTFNTVTSAANANLVVLLDTNEILGSFLGYFNPPGTLNEGVGVFDGTSWDRFAGGDLERGGFGFVTIVHELLHGLGLAHPHDTGGTSTIMTGVTADFDDFGDFDLNQGVFTTMSYNSGWHTGPAGTGPFTSGTYGFEGGPMAIDIAALQENYGVNASYNSGNNTYVLPTTNSTGTFFTAIWDTGGIDTISHSGARAATIDLRAATILEAVGGGGWVSFASGIAGGFTIANTVVIENAVGGSGNDTITGNDAANSILGNAGFDILTGGLGFDTIDGGIGNDTIDGGNGADLLLGGDGNDSILGSAGHDAIFGGPGNDRMIGGIGNDQLRGGLGFDTIEGGPGNDILLGENGFDLMAGGLGDDTMEGGAGNDRMLGGDNNDSMLGGLGYDTIDGGNGNDWIKGEIGNDLLAGNAGHDTIDGGVDNDYIAGGDGYDLLAGGTGNDTVNGGAGNDAVIGGAGLDVLIGGTGNDRLIGRAHGDTFVFADGHGDDIIVDFEALNNNEKIDLSAVSAITGLADLNLGSTTAGAATQVGANVVIDTGGGNSITLLNVALGDLDANDFIF